MLNSFVHPFVLCDSKNNKNIYKEANLKLTNIKIETWRREKKLKDLAEELNIGYQSFSSIINGFNKIPERFEIRCLEVFKKWDIEKE